MRLAAKIKGWLGKEQLLEWVQQAGDKCSYQKRLAIWLTAVGGLHAHVVAEMLGVSKQAVWKWIGQYNEYGPGGLWRQGRGGRNWAFLSEVEEANILYQVLKEADRPGLPSAAKIKKGSAARNIGLSAVGSSLYLPAMKFAKLIDTPSTTAPSPCRTTLPAAMEAEPSSV